MTKKGLLLLFLLALLLFVPASAALADGPRLNYDGGRIFIDEDVVLEPGETFEGDLGIFDGSLIIPAGSAVRGSVFVTNGDARIDGQVDGDVAVFNGDLRLAEGGRVTGDAFVMSGDQDISGQVDGDLSILFGDIVLRSTAVVGGDVAVLSGGLARDTGAQVRGEELSEIPFPKLPAIRERADLPAIPEVPTIPPIPEMPELRELPQVPDRAEWPQRVRVETAGDRIGRFFGRMVSGGFFGLLFIAAGLLVVIVWPKATREVADCITVAPVQGFGLGLLTFLIALVLEAVAAVLMVVIVLVAAALISTVILIPIGLLLILLSVLVLLPVPLALAGAVILGWVGLAEVIGRRVLKLIKVDRVQSLGAVLVGLLLTVALATTLWLFQPLCCAWPFVILLTSVGVGAVIHTRFGRQSCRESSSAPAAAPAAEALPPESMDEESGVPDGPTPAQS